MSDPIAEPRSADSATEPHGAVATAEPPAKPPAPPKTGVAAPRPGPKRRTGCWLAVLGLLVGLGLAAGLWWLLTPHSAPQQTAATGSSAFDSAMTKAMVKSPPAPTTPVELSTVEARGTHSFDATFTPEELTALVNAFPHEVVVGNTSVALSNVTVSQAADGELSLSGTVTSGDSSYTGKVTGQVAFTNGEVTATGPLTVQAEGFTLPDAQAQTATQVLLAYINGYLAAAPGLTVTEASVASTGVHAKGLAPDTIDF